MRGKKKYLVSYDISIDKERTKIAKLLEGYGKRVQYSVFECCLPGERYRELYQKLMEIICLGKDEEANIRIYPLCKNCEELVSIIGIDTGKKSSEINFLQEDIIII